MFSIWLFNQFGICLSVQDMTWVNKVGLQMNYDLDQYHWPSSSSILSAVMCQLCVILNSYFLCALPELNSVTLPVSIPHLLCIFFLKNFKFMLWSPYTTQKLESIWDFILPWEELLFAIKLFIHNHEFLHFRYYLLPLVRLCGFLAFTLYFSFPLYLNTLL